MPKKKNHAYDFRTCKGKGQTDCKSHGISVFKLLMRPLKI